MKRSVVLAAAFGLLVLPLLVAPPSSAEWFADIYGGAAFTQNHDVDIHSGSFGGVRTLVKDVAFDTADFVGGRTGYWFRSFDFLHLGVELQPGIGLDVSHVFGPDISRQSRTICADVCTAGSLDKVKIGITTIGVDAMLRYPLLRSDKFPSGQLQPYLTAGPAVFIAHATDTTNFLPTNQSDTDTRVGMKIGVGVGWQFHKNVAAFAEYRFTHLDPKFHFTDTILGGTDFSSSFNTHAILGGVSFRFR